jgi:hypothetical protein
VERPKVICVRERAVKERAPPELEGCEILESYGGRPEEPRGTETEKEGGENSVGKKGFLGNFFAAARRALGL